VSMESTLTTEKYRVSGVRFWTVGLTAGGCSMGRRRRCPP
jgi:hypothetical protein